MRDDVLARKIPFTRRASLRCTGVALAVSFAIGLVPSCQFTERVTEQGVRTATVSLSSEKRIAFDVPVSIELVGERRIDEVFVEMDMTVTASTSTRARAVLDALALDVARPDRDTVTLRLVPPEDVIFGGAIRVRMPSDLDVSVLERGGTADVSGIEGNMRLDSISSVKISDARADVLVGVQNGNAIVDTRALQSTRTEVQVAQGSIQLTLPARASADVWAEVSSLGEIAVAHPALPPSPNGKSPYHATVNGGLGLVVLRTGTGNIVIGSR